MSSAVQRLKTCGSERVTSSFTSVTCEQMFPGDVVEVTMTRVNSSLAFDMCDVGVYGRLYQRREYLYRHVACVCVHLYLKCK